MSKTKKDLEEDIAILKYNNKGLSQTINIQYARLKLAYEVLEKLGYTTKQISDMLQLPCEKR